MRRERYLMPDRPKKPRVPDDLKQQVQAGADKVIEELFRPEYVEAAPHDAGLPYIIDIYTKWYRHFFYFCSTYADPRPEAIRPTFENCFTRLEYAGGSLFHLAHMRHTGRWWESFRDLTLDAAMKIIREEQFFHP